MSDDTERQIGRLQATTEKQNERLERLEDKLDALLEYMNANKGGLKVILAAGSIGGALATAAIKLVAMIKGGS